MTFACVPLAGFLPEAYNRVMTRGKAQKITVKIIKFDDITLEYLDKLFKGVRFVACPNPNLVGYCWVRGNDSTIYTEVFYNGDSEKAHRVSYEIFKGKELDHYGLHHCDVPACINPDHIYDGTSSDNAADARARNVHFNFKNLKGKRNFKKLWKEYKKELIAQAKFNGNVSRGLVKFKTGTDSNVIVRASEVVEGLGQRLRKLYDIK